MASESTDHDKEFAELQLQIAAAMRAEQAVVSRDDFLKFCQHTLPDPEDFDNPVASRYKVEMHHKVFAEALQNVATGKCLRLIISCPPQHGKSELVSRRFPAWYIGKYPFRNIMHGTYNQDFANIFGDEVRNILQQPEFLQVFPKAQLRTGSKAKDHMTTVDGGKITFLGRGGAGTGKPADLFIIDDPIKDAKEAESATIRNDVWEWFTKVAYTRCHVLSAIIIVMTRWHEDDLVGRLTDPTNVHYDPKVGAQWEVINLPAIVDDDKLAAALGKKKGEALWPARFPLEHLETARLMNPYGFSALYMGRPTPPEGAFYQRDMLLGYEMKELPKNLRYYGTMDLAVSTERDRDKSAILNWGLDDNDTLWLLPDCYWGQANADASVETMIEYAKQYSWFEAFGEKGQIDRMIRPFLHKRMMETGVYFNMTSFPTTGNKGARSIAMRGRMAQGKVRFPKFASWWPAAQDQILKFTGSGDDREDDFCDAMALIGQALASQVKASRITKQGNVIKVGTMAWVKQASRAEREKQRRMKVAGGF